MNRFVGDKPTSIFAFSGCPLDKDMGLQSNQFRHFGLAVGQRLDKSPIGFCKQDLHRNAINRPE